MANQTRSADECQRLLDNGWTVTLFRNGMGSYTAVASAKGQEIDNAKDVDRQITDDFSPSKALHRLAEKMIGNIVESEH